jgi:hypothetical protein
MSEEEDVYLSEKMKRLELVAQANEKWERKMRGAIYYNKKSLREIPFEYFGINGRYVTFELDQNARITDIEIRVPMNDKFDWRGTDAESFSLRLVNLLQSQTPKPYRRFCDRPTVSILYTIRRLAKSSMLVIPYERDGDLYKFRENEKFISRRAELYMHLVDLMCWLFGSKVNIMPISDACDIHYVMNRDFADVLIKPDENMSNAEMRALVRKRWLDTYGYEFPLPEPPEMPSGDKDSVEYKEEMKRIRNILDSDLLTPVWGEKWAERAKEAKAGRKINSVVIKD